MRKIVRGAWWLGEAGDLGGEIKKVKPIAKGIEKPVSRRFDPNEIFKRVMSHVEMRKFVQANPNIPETAYRKALPKLSQYVRERKLLALSWLRSVLEFDDRICTSSSSWSNVRFDVKIEKQNTSTEVF